MTAMSQNLRLAETIFVTGQKFRYIYTIGRKRVCQECCGKERMKFALNRNWLIIADHVNRTGCTLKCYNCSSGIESM